MARNCSRAGNVGPQATHLAEIYRTEVSKVPTSRITDALVEELTTWQNRSLDKATLWIYRRARSRTAEVRFDEAPRGPE